ncbi:MULTISPECIES: enoyl-CoA hydratase-related protein [Candidatus Neomicrothrix]|jgi:enoyl-CoA hydratase|nr:MULTISPECIES: enoyl-CoA hydratase-related protein [Microthrix]NLH66387.1 enoyl-CoA hydratase [Candidatus Microthrix parvicella]MBK6501960.1 enoyl-CoA hydratase/isomerase family protein [Candidatus Microthrix sp.]MBK7018406.1 enoyl-CoA hydratase/isomerase family protein [Candidatus Microthrix sp.]MBK7322121.1 enoyl-CoA hydratase/isomerase family protein [Candidatus Microthrix sp.]MBL0206005.1 enoyl-CoA hydratase/isomerase family protein [Candidatus Microthrix sp.]
MISPVEPTDAPTVLSERLVDVAVITINRPRRRNALDGATVAALHQAISDAASGAPRVLVLTGADGHFCAGADITTTEDPDYTIGLRAMLDALAGLAFPTIAAIEGSCMGLGVQLALSVDLRVAAEDVRFAVPVARLGLLTDHRTLQRLALAVGWGMARSMVLAGDVLNFDDAWRLGLVQRRGGVNTALEWAEDIAKLAPLSQAGAKLGLDLLEEPVADDPRYREAFLRAWASDDLAEGRAAFAERRSPTFRGR